MILNSKYLQTGCVLIRHKWEEDSNRLIQTYTKNLETKLNYITKAVKVNLEEQKFGDLINEGDTLFLSRYLITCRKFKLDKSYIDNYDYSNIPAKMILGRFSGHVLNIGSLEMFMDKVLVEPINDLKIGSILLTENSQCDIGRVVKVGGGGLFRDYSRRKPLVKEGDVVLFWNNIETPLVLGMKKYSAVEDNRIIGTFKDGNLELDSLEMLQGRILLKDLKDEKIDLASNLVLPGKDNDFEFHSNPENKYEVIKVSETGREYRSGKFLDNGGVRAGDILMVRKDLLQHVFFKSEKFYTLQNLDNADVIIRL